MDITTTGLSEDEELALAMQLSLETSNNNFGTYLRKLGGGGGGGGSNNAPDNSPSPSDYSNILPSHTAFLLNIDKFLSICKSFSDKNEENKVTAQRVARLVMNAVANATIAMLDSNDSSDSANKFVNAILECGRKIDPKQLFEQGFAFVSEHLYHTITNVLLSGSRIIYDQPSPETIATDGDITAFLGGSDIPADFDELFNTERPSYHYTSSTLPFTTGSTDFNTLYTDDIIADFDKILSLGSSATGPLLADFFSLLRAFLDLVESTDFSSEGSGIHVEITHRLLELTKLYFELLCSNIRSDDDCGKSVREFLEIANSGHIIQSTSNILDKVAAYTPLAKNVRWVYGLAVLLGGIAPQLRGAESAALSDTLAVVALGNAVKMFTDGMSSPTAQVGGSSDSFVIRVLPGLQADLYNPVNAENALVSEIKSLGCVDSLEFFLRITAMYCDKVSNFKIFMLVVGNCVALMNKVITEATVIRPVHMSIFIHILGTLDKINDFPHTMEDFMRSFEGKLLNSKEPADLETTGAALAEICEKYKSNIPLHIIHFAYDIIASGTLGEPVVFNFLNRIIDDLIAVTQGEEFTIESGELVPYENFCLITYAFYYALSPESKLNVLIKMADFVIANQDKQLNQLGLIRFLSLLISFFRMSWSLDNYIITNSWDAFLAKRLDVRNFNAHMLNPCRVYYDASNAGKKLNFLLYMAPAIGIIQGNYGNMNAVTSEYFKVQPALLNLVSKSLNYGSSALMNNYFVCVVLEVATLFSVSTETLIDILNGKMFNPTSIITVFALDVLNVLGAGYTPYFVDTSKVNISLYANALNLSLETLSASFEARTRCDVKSARELDLVIYSICLFYYTLFYPCLMNPNNGINDPSKLLTFPPVMIAAQTQNRYMNRYLGRFISDFFNANMLKIFQLGKRIVEFYFDLRVRNAIGKFGDEALNIAHFFTRSSLPPDTCFVLPASLSDKLSDIKQELFSIYNEIAPEQRYFDFSSEIKFYLELNQEKLSLVNIHAFVSFLIASLLASRNIMFYPQMVESIQELYYIDNLYGIRGLINNAVSGGFGNTAIPYLIKNTAKYLTLVVTNVDENTIAPLESIVNIAINTFYAYPESDPNYSKVTKIFLDVLLISTDTTTIQKLCKLFAHIMNENLSTALFTSDVGKLEAFLRRAFSSAEETEYSVLNMFIAAIRKGSQAHIGGVFESACRVLQEATGAKEGQDDDFPRRSLQTLTMSLAFAGRCVPQLVSMLIDKCVGEVAYSRAMLGTIIELISGNITVKQPTFAKMLEENPPPAKRSKIRFYACHDCKEDFRNVVCCAECSEKCHRGHDLEHLEDDGEYNFCCRCCGPPSAPCHKCGAAGSGGGMNKYNEKGTHIETVKSFYNQRRDQAFYMGEIAKRRSDLLSIFASEIEKYPEFAEPAFTKDNEFFMGECCSVEFSRYVFKKLILGNKLIPPTATPTDAKTYFSPMCRVGDNLAICTGDKIVFLSTAKINAMNTATFPVTDVKVVTLKTVSRIMNICPHPAYTNVFVANNVNMCSVVVCSKEGTSVIKEIPIRVGKPIVSIAWLRKMPAELCVTGEDEVLIYNLEESTQAPAHSVKLPAGAAIKGTAVIGFDDSAFITIATATRVYSYRPSAGAKELVPLIEDDRHEIHAIQYLEQLSSLVLSFVDKQAVIFHLDVSKETGTLVVDKRAALIQERLRTKSKIINPSHNFVSFLDSEPVIVFATTERDTALGVTLSKTPQVQMFFLQDAIACVVALKKSPLEQYVVFLTDTGAEKSIALFNRSSTITNYDLGEDVTRDKIRSSTLMKSNLEYRRRRGFRGVCFDASSKFVRVSVINKEPKLVVTGLGIHVGSSNPEYLPDSILVFNKQIRVNPNEARWYDVHFTPAEMLLARKGFHVTFFAKRDANKVSIDAIVPYGIENSLVFGRKLPTDDETMDLLTESTESALKDSEAALVSSSALSYVVSFSKVNTVPDNDEFVRSLERATRSLLRVVPRNPLSFIKDAVSVAKAHPEHVARCFSAFLSSAGRIPPKPCVQYFALYLSIVRDAGLNEDAKAMLHSTIVRAVSESVSEKWSFTEVKTVLGEALGAAAYVPRALEIAHVFLTAPDACVRVNAVEAIEALLVTAYETTFSKSSGRRNFSDSLKCPKGIGVLGARELVMRQSKMQSTVGIQLEKSPRGVEALRSLLRTLVDAMERSIADERIESDRLVQESRAVSTLIAEVGPFSTLGKLASIFAPEGLDMSNNTARKGAIVMGTIASVLKKKGALDKRRLGELAAAVEGFPQSLPEQVCKAVTALAAAMESMDNGAEIFSSRIVESALLLGKEDALSQNLSTPQRWSYSALLLGSLLEVSLEMIKHDTFKPLFSDAKWMGFMDIVFRSDKLLFVQGLAKGISDNFNGSDMLLFKHFDEKLHSEVLSIASRFTENAYKLSKSDVFALAKWSIKELSVALQRPSSWTDFCIKNPHVFMVLLYVSVHIAEFAASRGGSIPSTVANTVPIFLYLAAVVTEAKEVLRCGKLFNSEVTPFDRLISSLCVCHPSAHVRSTAARVLTNLLPLLDEGEISALAESVETTLEDVAAGYFASTSEFMEFVTAFASSGKAPRNFELVLLGVFTEQIKYLSHYRDAEHERNDYGCPFCHEYPAATDTPLEFIEKRWTDKGNVSVNETGNCVSFEFPDEILCGSVVLEFAEKPTLFSVYYKTDGTWCLANYKVVPDDKDAVKLEYPLFIPISGLKIELERCKSYAHKCVTCGNANCSIYCTKCHSFMNEIKFVVLQVDEQSFSYVSGEKDAAMQRKDLEDDLGEVASMAFVHFTPK